MRIVQIGLGSMGKRRLRNLAELGVSDVVGFDLREDRREEASTTYGVKTVGSLDDELLASCDALVISTPPNLHLPYLEAAVDKMKPAFVEASVVLEGLPAVARAAAERGVLIAPSCTLRFHPSIRTIKEIVAGGEYGRITNFVYYMGQYLPDWHPWEDIKGFYVSKRETSATREMVPFELTWLTDIAGWPTEVAGFYGKTLDMGVDIDDTYSINLRFGDALGTLVVDVVARYATRQLILNLEKAQVRWSWDENVVRLYDPAASEWREFRGPEGHAAEGYNPNIIEEMYTAEMAAFLEAVRGEAAFPNTLEDDIRVLTILADVEATNSGVRL
jgi:predicted dehydrogenase